MSGKKRLLMIGGAGEESLCQSVVPEGTYTINLRSGFTVQELQDQVPAEGEFAIVVTGMQNTDVGSLRSVLIPMMSGEGRVYLSLEGDSWSFSSSNFYGHNELLGVEIFGVGAITNSMFASCENLKSVVIDATTISISAFSRCSSLNYVCMPFVEAIGESAFSSCDSLSWIDLPGSLGDLYGYSFAMCGALSCVRFNGNEQPLVGESVFMGTNVSNIIVPSGYTDSMFGDLPVIKTIPEECKEVFS